MQDEGHKSSELSKKLVAINQEDRRQMQYMMLKEWDAGILTGVETIEHILDLEKIINIDIGRLRRARAGKVIPKGT